MKEIARAALAVMAVAEVLSADDRFKARERMYALASERARTSGKKLVVVGDPNSGAHTRIQAAYGCGDVCVDLTGCPACADGVSVDITQGRITVDDGAGVIFCSCVLEYVSNPYLAWNEFLRVAGRSQDIFLVTVQPDTFTRYLYPGAKWVIERTGDGIVARPVEDESKMAVLLLLGYLGARAY